MTELYEISTEADRLDIDLIHQFLGSSYWAKNIPLRVVEESIKHSLCFGVYCAGNQVGFGRVISDYATFAYLADVFVVPHHRGRGLSKRLVRAMLDHPNLQGLRRILLATQDAHGLYAQFGFQPLTHPENVMTIANLNVYV